MARDGRLMLDVARTSPSSSWSPSSTSSSPGPEPPVGLHGLFKRGGGRLRGRRGVRFRPPHRATGWRPGRRPGAPVAVGWVGAMLLAGLAALIVGAVTVRLRRYYLAIADLRHRRHHPAGRAERRAPDGRTLPPGLRPHPRPGFSSSEPAVYNGCYLAVVLAVVALVYAALERLVRSPWGRVSGGSARTRRPPPGLGRAPPSPPAGVSSWGDGDGSWRGRSTPTSSATSRRGLRLDPDLPRSGRCSSSAGRATTGAPSAAASRCGGLWKREAALSDGRAPPGIAGPGRRLQVVLIGVALAAVLLFRPRGSSARRRSSPATPGLKNPVGRRAGSRSPGPDFPFWSNPDSPEPPVTPRVGRSAWQARTLARPELIRNLGLDEFRQQAERFLPAETASLGWG